MGTGGNRFGTADFGLVAGGGGGRGGGLYLGGRRQVSAGSGFRVGIVRHTTGISICACK